MRLDVAVNGRAGADVADVYRPSKQRVHLVGAGVEHLTLHVYAAQLGRKDFLAKAQVLQL